jgi:hypothetical protein
MVPYTDHQIHDYSQAYYNPGNWTQQHCMPCTVVLQVRRMGLRQAMGWMHQVCEGRQVRATEWYRIPQ